MPILLDTHAWVWWVSADRRLSQKAATAIRRVVQDEEGAWLSTISIWEVAKKVEKGQIVLDRPLREWMDYATTVPGLLSPPGSRSPCRRGRPASPLPSS